MSYRTIKRLLGETSLERKCRTLLGGGLFVLILLSFFLFGLQNESLYWEQTRRTGQLLVNRVVREKHLLAFARENERFAKAGIKGESKGPDTGLGKFLVQDEETQDLGGVNEYKARIIRPNLPPTAPVEMRTLTDVTDRDLKKLINRAANDDECWYRDEQSGWSDYLKAVRIQKRCLDCHPTAMEKSTLKIGAFADGDLMAAVNVRFPLAATEMQLNVNRAILLSFAIGTAVLAMLFAYITVRYVIVKPVAHLKEVSEEIAAGNLTIRSDIRTGDEFQELSFSFNRMLRSLVAMQDELRRVNADLDQRLDELAKANMSLFEMNRLKSEFLATISHELRTPLNSILGFGDLLAKADALPEKKQRWVHNIQNSGKLLLALINDILDLAKLEAGKMQIHSEELSIRDLVEGQLAMVRPLADQKNIALASEIDPGIPILRQDGKKLAQIMSNLLSNAIKFTPEGGRIGVSCRLDRAHFLISVWDNGVGIAPDDQKLVFEKFRQAESTLTRNHGGTGLGLSIVRELTKLLGGGEVLLESQLGGGSTFTIRLPIQLTEQVTEDLSLGKNGLDHFRDMRRPEVRYYSSRDGAGKQNGA